MARYIDADKLIAHLEDEIRECKPPQGGRAGGKSIAYGTMLGLKSAIAFADALAAADVEPVKSWISVDERLPESDKFVIVCDEYGNVYEAYFYKQDREFRWVDDEEIAFATHWMPLPERPKGE